MKKQFMLGRVAQNLYLKEERQKYTPHAVRALYAMKEYWGLTGKEVQGLLGYSVSLSTVYRWQRHVPQELNMDNLHRIFYLVKLHKVVSRKYDEETAQVWLHERNNGKMCRGISPLQVIFLNGIIGIQGLSQEVESLP